MPEFSVITQQPVVRAVVQDGFLERAFRDGLFPRLIFRGESAPVPWVAGVGDSAIFTSDGAPDVDCTPLQPGFEPQPFQTIPEQWIATMGLHEDTADTFMPNDYVAIAKLFLRQAHRVGLRSALRLDTITRDRLYNAAESGWTVSTGVVTASASVHVQRINGFVTARNPTISGASPVQYAPVSSANPLSIVTVHAGTATANTVVGCTPDIAGDIYGPGVLTLGSAVTLAARDPVLAADRSNLQLVGGGNSIDALGSTDVPTLDDVHALLANFRQDSVPEHADGFLHAHIGPVPEVKLLADPFIKQMLTALPDHYMARAGSMGVLAGTVFFRNARCPIRATVVSGSDANGNGLHDGTNYAIRDPFAPELYTGGSPTASGGGVAVNRILFTGQGSIMEYYADLEALVTEAGLNGTMADPKVTNNGIEVFCERIKLIIRAPVDRGQDTVSVTSKFMGDWPVRTDGATGSPARYKRVGTLISA